MASTGDAVKSQSITDRMAQHNPVSSTRMNDHHNAILNRSDMVERQQVHELELKKAEETIRTRPVLLWKGSEMVTWLRKNKYERLETKFIEHDIQVRGLGLAQG